MLRSWIRSRSSDLSGSPELRDVATTSYPGYVFKTQKPWLREQQPARWSGCAQPARQECRAPALCRAAGRVPGTADTSSHEASGARVTGTLSCSLPGSAEAVCRALERLLWSTVIISGMFTGSLQMETECLQKHYTGHLISSGDEPVPGTRIQRIHVQPLWL